VNSKGENLGKKGDKLTEAAATAAEEISGRLLPLGDITSKKMFGGYGIFEGGKMFALVDTAGDIYLKVSDGNRSQYEAAGAQRHGRMPYYQIPEAVMADNETLLEWARSAIALSKSA
jgi:DNA transformation protein